ncbi:MAG: response regulator [Deltaproteobacteria bacterium]|nr:response regulator [Deltaproteobacteria bacterium]
MKALIVEDSETMRKIIRSYLKGIGIETFHEASDGLRAVELVRFEDYACIFLDLHLPTMGGLDVLKAIRGSGNTVPVMVVTTDRQKYTILDAIRAGANDYVTKPFDRETLLQKTKRMLRLEVPRESSKRLEGLLQRYAHRPPGD